MIRNKGNRLNAYVKDYVVFDLETTGINLNRDEIIEISGIKVRDNKIVDKFTTLVNPCMHIPGSATAVNGITDAMVRYAPLLKNALGDFLAFIGQDILVGHNIHTFDTNFLYDGALRELDIPVQNDYVDTLYMAKRTLPQLDHHRLVDVAAYFHLDTKGAHRALFDCEMNQQCYEKIGQIWVEQQKQQTTYVKNIKVKDADVQIDENSTVAVCRECGCIMIQRKGKFGSFLGCSSYPICRYTQKV